LAPKLMKKTVYYIGLKNIVIELGELKLLILNSPIHQKNQIILLLKI